MSAQIITGTSYTVQSTDQNNQLLFTANSAVAVTLPNSFALGFIVELFQIGTGQVTASVASGGSLVSPNVASTTAQFSSLYCIVISNSSGTNAQWDVIAKSLQTAGIVGATTLASLYGQDSSASYAQYSLGQVLNDPGVSFTGSISGSVLTASAVTGTFAVGMLVAGAGVAASTFISSFGTGTGGAGTYNLSTSGTVSSEAMTASGNGTFLKTGTGTGAGNWTQQSSVTLSGLSTAITNETARAEAAEDQLAGQMALLTAQVTSLQKLTPMPNWLTNTSFGASVFSAGLNKSPTLFYDPTATSSSGAGTLHNPFYTLAQVEAAVTGLVPGMVLGIKRGTYTKGTLSLSAAGSAMSPLYIVPYGDDLGIPVFSGETARTSWTQYSGDTRIWQLTGISQGVDVFDIGYVPYGQVGSRLLCVTGANLAAKITAIQNYISAPVAGTAGVFAYDTTTLYAWFVDSTTEANPNLGQVITADQTNAIKLQPGPLAQGGNLIICGIAAYFARNNSLSFLSGATPTSLQNVQVIGCEGAYSGTQTVGGLGQDGISIYGASQSVKLTGLVAKGNYSHDCENNALEIAYTDGAVVEYNLGVSICGNSVVELWSNNTNATVMFNRGYGDVNYGLKQNVGHACGVWATNYSDGGGVNTNSAYNGGHLVAFNYIQDFQAEAIDNRSKNNTYLNNTLISVNLVPNNGFFYFQGNDPTTTGCVVYNNLCIQDGGTGGSSRQFIGTTGGPSTPIPTSDYNCFLEVSVPSRGYAHINTTSYTNLSTWNGATGNDAHSHGLFLHGTGGFGYSAYDPSSFAGFSVVSTWRGANTSYLLTGDTLASNAGTSIASYGITTDVDGNWIDNTANPDMGCLQL